MYRVLYRKWRPRVFDDVAGQPQVTRTLQNEIKAGRINHAYLFTGCRGTGKTTCAKIFAKAVNCLNPSDGNPCGECENCSDTDRGELLDIVEMDAASNRGIDDIRDVIEKAQFAPSRGKYRVYIVDEVHMLTEQAFNALLKTLEEPPQHVIFILATTEVHKLPATIISRCQRFDFYRISPEIIADRLCYIASQEGITLTDDAALLIAAVADGAMRDALSLLDRCMALSENVDSAVVRKAAGLAEKDYLFELAACCINKNSAKALELVDRLYNEAKDMARLCREMIDHFRNLMIIKTVKSPENYLVLSEDELEKAQTQADYLTLEEIVYIIDLFQQCNQRMGKGSSNRTELETTLIKLSAPELDFSMDALLSRISALESAVKKGACTPLRAASADDAPSAADTVDKDAAPVENGEETASNRAEGAFSDNGKPAKNNIIDNMLTPQNTGSNTGYKEEPKHPATDVPARPSVDYDSLFNNARPFLKWPEVVEHLGKFSKTIAMFFTDTNAFESGNYLLIDAKSPVPFEMLRDSEKRRTIKDAISEITGKKYNLGPYKKPEKPQEKQEDPLEVFAKRLEKTDIKVKNEEEE